MERTALSREPDILPAGLTLCVRLSMEGRRQQDAEILEDESKGEKRAERPPIMRSMHEPRNRLVNSQRLGPSKVAAPDTAQDLLR